MEYLAIDHIVATPDICGGKPRIDGTRMRVQDVVIYHHGGMSTERLAEGFGLTFAQIHAALAYYYDHKIEIDHDLQEEKTLSDQYLAEGKATLSGDLSRRPKQ